MTIILRELILERMPSASVAVLTTPIVPVKSTAAKIDVAIFVSLTSFLCILIIDIARSVPGELAFIGTWDCVSYRCVIIVRCWVSNCDVTRYHRKSKFSCDGIAKSPSQSEAMLENGNNAMTVWLVGEFPQIFPCNGQLRKLPKR